jgi:hypothetical protein
MFVIWGKVVLIKWVSGYLIKYNFMFKFFLEETQE